MEPTSKQQDWLDQVQAGQLTPEVVDQLRRELRARPAEAARLEDELSLNAALGSLPPAPVSSNFVARVMAEIEREQISATRRSVPWWTRAVRIRILGTATAAALFAMALGGWWQTRLHHRQALAASVSAVSGAAAVPGVEWLQDFDAIQLLRTSAQPSDVELIAALATP
ncbi:MAG TPA: hypothetical protein PLX89_12045 [Verrucomicrobiota bacterium]|nr:hypothetical protein [Verrucomicrobiota bacterium]